MTLQNQTQISGTLYVVATPIGNLGDITRRAVETLEKVDWVAAEDTRHSKPLLHSLGINQTLISLHEHNEQQRSEQLLEKLKNGEDGALISDAGTPLINDPGYFLVKLLRDEGIRVVPLPGPSAVIAALSAAGLPTDRFTYEGFLPARGNKRLLVLQGLATEVRTLVFYESPHRLIDCLESMLTAFGDEREIVVARELTKKFEQFVSGSLQEVRRYFTDHSDKVRGEFVLMLKGAPIKSSEDGEAALIEQDKMIKVMLKQSLPVKQISEIIAELTGEKKKPIYQRVLELKE
ncbi:16S rRNA (cytidine(1402)-2'-O)-methyltransferase [Thiomicrorhabdus lithotrophica]|uniref:Ribosomal RNA small subunit methyltransferase I n=1 Tax=Thiomicrorhabdus lithotrophica TaxID=2949997 RepID=A0ABY8C7W2_9GAMM|nr:16S rRNA (cytidine(1402)-2'-O)-methyltransferase [Thiomicrorhabdus lithotrophica]WEJ62061.1 16S rRNA (cytidine(1402)-2'-O)-methyltransferase [Thiomicrorhabdus lithotrophica]